MSKPLSAVQLALQGFVNKMTAQCELSGLPQLPFEQEWPSPCWQNQADEGILTLWRPVLQSSPQDMFERLSHALEVEIHPDIQDYFTLYWSDSLPAKASQGELSLIQVWNPDDMERLRANLIGHALDKKRRKLPLTLFFAVTLPDGNLVLSLDNADGTIWLEAPGKPPHQCLANSLAEFINQLEPLPFE